MLLSPIFAEVADKEPTLGNVYALTAICSLGCILFSLWRPWGIVLALLGAAFSVFVTIGWLQDPNEGPAILRELGQSYVTHAYIAGFIPTLAVVVGISIGSVIRSYKHVVA